MWLMFFQASTTQPQNVDLPTSVQGAIIVVLLLASHELPNRLLTYLDLRIQERKKRVDALDSAYKRIDKLSEDVDGLLKRMNTAEENAERRQQQLETQRQVHEQQVSQIKDEFTLKMVAAVKEVAEGKDVVINSQAATIQTLTTQLKEVTEQRDQLLTENFQLKQKLKVTDTDEHPVVGVPPVLDDVPPIPPEDDPPSSTHLTPGVPG